MQGIYEPFIFCKWYPSNKKPLIYKATCYSQEYKTKSHLHTPHLFLKWIYKPVTKESPKGTRMSQVLNSMKNTIKSKVFKKSKHNQIFKTQEKRFGNLVIQVNDKVQKQDQVFVARLSKSKFQIRDFTKFNQLTIELVCFNKKVYANINNCTIIGVSQFQNIKEVKELSSNTCRIDFINKHDSIMIHDCTIQMVFSALKELNEIYTNALSDVFNNMDLMKGITF